MSTAALSLQKAIHQTLTGHAPLMAQVSAVVDGPAPDQPLPYVQLGDSIETDWSAKSFSGREHRVSIHVWSGAPGTAQARQLMALVDDALKAGVPALAGHKLVTLSFLAGRVVTSDNNRVRHGIADYRARTQPLS